MHALGLKAPSRVDAEDLVNLHYYESRLLPLDVNLAALQRVIDGLQLLGNDWTSLVSAGDQALPPDSNVLYQNHSYTIAAYRENARVLMHKAQSSTRLLDGIMSVQNQSIAKLQNNRLEYMTTMTVDDSATVRVIGVISLVYLSFTSIAVTSLVILVKWYLANIPSRQSWTRRCSTSMARKLWLFQSRAGSTLLLRCH